MRKLLTAGCTGLLVLLAAWPAAASQPAPPQYQSSEPSDGATLHEAPERVEVTFDQPLDESSSLSIVDECERDIDDDRPVVEGNTMTISVTEKPSGMYHVEYLARGLGGVTGENDGMFMFTVHGGDPCDGGSGGNHHNNGGGNGHNNGHGGNDQHEGGKEHGSGTHMTGNHTSGSAHTGTHAGGSETHGAGGDHKNMGHAGGDHPKAPEKDVPDQAAGDAPGISSSDTARKLLSRADSGTLLMSLALCALLGVLGGAILRATSAK